MIGQGDKGLRRPTGAAAATVLAALIFTALAIASIEWTRSDARFAAVWLPNAVMLSIILIRRGRVVPILVGTAIGGFASNMLASAGPVLSSMLAAANLVEVGAAFALLKLCGMQRLDFARVGHLTGFTLCAGILAPALAALVATGALSVQGNEASFAAWASWLLTGGLGMVLIVPPAIIAHQTWRSEWEAARAQPQRWPAPMALLTLVTIGVFIQADYPFLFLCAPVILFVAYRLGMLATALGTLIIAAIATFETWQGSGPIALMRAPFEHKLIVLQLFLATTFLSGLPIAAALTRKRRLLADLEDRERQLGLLANNVTDAVLRYDLTGKCIDASPSVATVLGRPREDFLGMSAEENTAHPDAAATIAAVQRRLVSGESDKERFTYRRALDDPQGKPVHIEADCAVVRDPVTGERQTIIVCARDVTERVNLEHLLVRARRHAENAAQAKSQFLANMSHEIRTPMNGVLGFAQLLKEAQLPPEQARYVALISESGETMMHLLNDILDISKIEAGQIAIVSEPVDIRHVLNSCVALHSANAAEKAITLSVHIDDALPQMMVCDALRLRQIIVNLLGNAIKFTDAGAVSIEATAHAGEVKIAVSDTGVGIAADRLQGIFNPFEQEDGRTVRRFGGTGLGLAISRQLAELMDGSLTVKSSAGHGSRFTVTLPLREAVPEADAVPDAESRTASLSARPSRILLAEDHDINRMLATAMLEKLGMEVHHAADGHEAVEAVLEADGSAAPFDLVLMDVQMPKIDGYEATRTLRASGIGAHDLPIIALTANAFEDDIRNASQAGMQGHLAKPMRSRELAAMLAKWLPADAAQSDEPAPSEPAATAHSPALLDRWHARRKEALDATSEALRKGAFTGEDAQELARTIHKLAGTAGMFGEDHLGDLATRLEQALREEDTGTAQQVAAELLAAA